MYSIEFPSKKPKTTKQKQKKLEEKPKTANVKKMEDGLILVTSQLLNYGGPNFLL